MPDLFLLALRLVHILAGVFWAGSASLFAGFIEPSVRAAGPGGGRFMQRLMQQRQLSLFLSVAALLTILSGLLLYWRASSGLQLSWILSPGGLSLSLGGLAGILAAILGMVVNRPVAERIGVLGREMQAAGGPPLPAQAAEMQALQARLTRAVVAGAALIGLAVAGMAVARYL